MYNYLSEKANVLIEAFPHLKKFRGKVFVIKFGGGAMPKMNHVIEDIVLLKRIGIKPVVVHGGGPEIDKELKKINMNPKFINGLRYTDHKTIEIVENVFKRISNEIVDNITNHGGKATNDNGYIKVKQKSPGLGLVGEIIGIDKNRILKIVKSGVIPIISPLGMDDNKKHYNINADTTASHVAVALNAEKLTILTDVDGIIIEGRLLSRVDFNTAKKEIKQGTINKGMIPKVDACVYAVKNKCPKAHLLNGLTPHSLLLEIFTDRGIGTEIVS
jgi:acetylglutamate kinase|tara:strand:- start:2402 stop:3220 length:819 start_codon:yes stop_codon:yes gene_type:complete